MPCDKNFILKLYEKIYHNLYDEHQSNPSSTFSKLKLNQDQFGKNQKFDNNSQVESQNQTKQKVDDNSKYVRPKNNADNDNRILNPSLNSIKNQENITTCNNSKNLNVDLNKINKNSCTVQAQVAPEKTTKNNFNSRASLDTNVDNINKILSKNNKIRENQLQNNNKNFRENQLSIAHQIPANNTTTKIFPSAASSATNFSISATAELKQQLVQEPFNKSWDNQPKIKSESDLNLAFCHDGLSDETSIVYSEIIEPEKPELQAGEITNSGHFSNFSNRTRQASKTTLPKSSIAETSWSNLLNSTINTCNLQNHSFTEFKQEKMSKNNLHKSITKKMIMEENKELRTLLETEHRNSILRLGSWLTKF